MKDTIQNIRVYTVSAEKSLSELAEAFSCSLAVLRNLNGRLGPVLKEGDQVSVPCNYCPEGGFYTIENGHTIYAISQCTGIPLEDILQSNPGLDLEQCMEGQVIVLPFKKRRYGGKTKKYIVKEEDTLPQLLVKLGMGIPLLEELNSGLDLFSLKEGEELTVIDWPEGIENKTASIRNMLLSKIAEKQKTGTM